MTQQLSPAAEAILDAAEAGLDGYIELLPPTWKSSVAAALRAATQQIEDLYCADLVIDDSDGAVFVLRQLMLIADELEAQ